jgi:hypothetical protein
VDLHHRLLREARQHLAQRSKVLEVAPAPHSDDGAIPVGLKQKDLVRLHRNPASVLQMQQDSSYMCVHGS